MDLKELSTWWYMREGRRYGIGDLEIEIFRVGSAPEATWLIEFYDDPSDAVVDQFWATEVPLSAPGRRPGTSHYAPRDPSFGLLVPVWQGRELVVFDDDPWDAMRPNPAGRICAGRFERFIAIGDFAAWALRQKPRSQIGTVSWHGPYHTMGWKFKAGRGSTDPYHIFWLYKLPPNWREQSHTPIRAVLQLYGVRIKIGALSTPGDPASAYYLWKEDDAPATPGTLLGTFFEQPLWSAPNRDLFIYHDDPWSDFMV